MRNRSGTSLEIWEGDSYYPGLNFLFYFLFIFISPQNHLLMLQDYLLEEKEI